MLAAESKGRVTSTSSSTTSQPHSVWEEIVEPVKPFLGRVAKQLSDQVDAFDPEVVPYTRYALMNQGKQLRPVLVALSGGATGHMNEDLVRVAVIIEMVHLATLVHDDVMDEAEVRRRRPTLAVHWGNQISVLVGDCLFAHAVRLAASFPSPEVCRAVASATNTVCSGEILQSRQRSGFDVTRSEYFKVIEMKTAELFALSCDLGAWLGGASQSGRQALRQYGLNLGTAYQIYDDCLDLFGREATVGKSLGCDLANGKVTLPILVALERADSADQTFLRDCVQDWDPSFFPRILELLDKYDARNSAREVIDQYLRAARRSLEPISNSPSRESLIAMTQFLAQLTDSLAIPN